MKKHLLSLLVLLMTTLSTYAYDFQSGDLYYNITSETTVEVTYQVYDSKTNYQGLSTATIPETVTYDGTTYSVTSIGDKAFYYCSDLTSITISESITSIKEYAFYKCTSLSSVTIPKSVISIGRYAFYFCSALTKTNYTGGIADWCAIDFEGCSVGNPTYTSKNLYINDVLVTDLVIPFGVEFIGHGAFAGCHDIQSITISSSVTQIGIAAFDDCIGLTSLSIPYSVKIIGNHAFEDCSNLSSITIPSSVTTIGVYAFRDCSSLLSITLPNSVTLIGQHTFENCSSLTSVSILGPIKEIDENMFKGCYSLTSINIPETVKTIEAEAFYGCSSLTSINIPEAVTKIGNSTFYGCSSLTSINIPEAVKSIEYSTFYDCSSLTSINIPEAVTEIGSSAFYGCSSLTSINIPEAVTKIGNSTFYGCSSLTSINIPEAVKSIEYSTFYDCSSLTSINIPEAVTEIGSSAFYGCSSLTSINIPEAVKSIEYSTFYDCSSLTSINIPEAVTEIGSSAFYGCSSLTSINIPEAVTEIGSSAFYGCSSLTSINIPETVKTIEAKAFYGCSSLTSINIPEAVTKIGNSAFSGCSSLTSINIPEAVTTIGNNVFMDCTSLTSVIWNAKQCAATEWKTGSNYWDKVYYGPFANIKSQITSFIIGKEVENVPSYLCYGMSSLDSIMVLSCTPPTCGNSVFTVPPYQKTLIVPGSSLDAYKNSNGWKDEFTLFGKCLSIFVQTSDSVIGIAQIDQDVDCDSVAIISAIGNPGYAFTQWSDGNTDNPRTVLITQDTTFTAEFGLAYSGKCGDDLYWAYSNKEVKITGTGAMYNYTDSTMPWTLLRDSIKTVRVGNNATSIGEYAFANTPKLAELYIGANVEDIGANAFAGCRRLYDIYCYPIEPPFADISSFANYNVYVYVPCENQRDYLLDVVWGEFKFIECIGSEDVVVTDDEVVVAPSYEDVTITWPVVSGADTYSLVLTKEGDTFCTLVFNAQGQLVSIAFKPARQNAPAEEDTTPATYAEQTANGFRFTVTGLDEGTDYAYTLTVRNASNSVLETYTGEFTTLSNTPTGISDRPDTTETVSDKGAEKLLRDGQVLILRNGETYDMMGQRL
ncbi:MAG: leucine-rich repeat protein [Paludibacteraceae bacterium]